MTDLKGKEETELKLGRMRPPKRNINHAAKLADYRLCKRQEFDNQIRRAPWNTGVWIKYARWEESQKDSDSARLLWERALEVDYPNRTLWPKYAEFGMKNEFVNHTRNVWDSSCNRLPRVDQLWYKYVHMEEMLGNIAGARQIVKRWMNWMPDEQGWLSYIKFEFRYNEFQHARDVFERFLQCHPNAGLWIRFAKTKNGEVGRARDAYERAEDDTDMQAQKKECIQRLSRVFVKTVGYFRTSAREVKEERAMLLEEWLNMERSFGEVSDVGITQSKLPKS